MCCCHGNTDKVAAMTEISCWLKTHYIAVAPRPISGIAIYPSEWRIFLAECSYFGYRASAGHPFVWPPRGKSQKCDSHCPVIKSQSLSSTPCSHACRLKVIVLHAAPRTCDPSDVFREIAKMKTLVMPQPPCMSHPPMHATNTRRSGAP